jgi:leucine dehydrogenase
MASIFPRLVEHHHEQLMFWSDPEVGYRGIIAVHDTTLGAAMGGTRFWDYQSEQGALEDVLRLARAMTYKAAVAGLAAGGGKAVILGDNRITDREPVFRAHGRAVQSLGGRYITAEDVGTSVEDMEFVRRETEFVTGLQGKSGDPSPLTALGIVQAIRASATERYGDGSLDGIRIAVQGLGNVGRHLCEQLAAEGARLTVTDIDPERVARVEEACAARAVPTDEIYSVDAEVFAPCALGGVINDDTLPVFRFEIVAGGANNQLAEPRHAEELRQRGILYAPDYVGNAGGLVNIYGELKGWSPKRSRQQVEAIFGTMLRVFALAREEGTNPAVAADRLAEERIRAARRAPRTGG